MVEQATDTDARDVNDQRRAFLEARASIIGATDSPKILGLSRYGTALSVFEDKTNPQPGGETSLPAWLGLKLQNTVAELYTARTGARVRADNLTHRMAPPYDYIGCHLDFRVLGQRRRLVECKTRAFMRGWGEDGTDIIPAEVWVQVQHEMLVTNAVTCDVAVLFGHHTFHVYTIERKQAFLDKLMVTLQDFRFNHWIPNVPPAPTGHAADTAIVKDRHPAHDDTLKPATPEQVQLIEMYSRARMNAAQAKLAEAELKNKITDIIGEAAGITGPFGTITWKRTQDSQEVHWDQVAMLYRRMLEAIEGGMPGTLAKIGGMPGLFEQGASGDLDTIMDLYTTTKPGYRRIDVRLTEEDENAE